MKIIDMVDWEGNVLGTMEVEGPVPESDPMYNLIEGIDTDKSFTIMVGKNRWSGVFLRTRVVN